MRTDNQQLEVKKPWIKKADSEDRFDEEEFDPNVFEGSKIEEYRILHERLWHNLVTAHSSMYVLKEVFGFPVNLFLSPHHDIFFSLLVRNFYFEVALIVHNALAGTESSLTIESLKKWLRENAIDHKKGEIASYIDRVASGEEVKRILDRLTVLRHKLIAHFDKKFIQNRTLLTKASVELKELEILLKETDAVINKLCLEGGMSLTPFWYGPDKEKSDIYQILNAIAKDSALLKMPEEQPDYWPVYKGNLTKDQRQVFNHWRKRLCWNEVVF